MISTITSAGVDLYPSVSATASLDNIVINEIMFDPVGDDAGNEWIELYNKGTEPVNIDGWTVSDRTGSVPVTLPNWDFPNDAYLVVHFGTGTDDNDFSDGEGDFYTGVDEEIFDNIEDECALYDGAPSKLTIIDFISWCFDGEYNPGTAHDYAVTAGIWDSGDYFGAPPPYSWMRRQLIIEGESIGRDKDSTDTNQPEDWDGTGGKDAIAPTPGARNLHLLGLCAQPPQQQQPSKEWTIMVYLDGDNNLERNLFMDLDEMEQVGSDANINIVFQFDGFGKVHEVTINGGRIPVPNTYGKAFRGYLKPEPVRDHTLVYIHPAPDGIYYLDEVDMGVPATLTDFVQWAMNWFPANKYALIINDHGAGWKGVAVDDTSGKDWLYMGELKDALAPVPVVLDILGFDACLMGMIEVGYQVRQNADILVASEETISCEGWPYFTILTGLKANPDWTGTQLATRIVNDYHTYYTNNPDPTHTLSAISLGADFLDLVSKVSAFADDMLGEHAQDEWGLEDYDFRFTIHGNPNDNVQINVRNALLATERYDDKNYKDLYDFMKNINEEGSIPPEYKIEAVPIMNKLVTGAGVVIEEKHGPDHCNSHGLSIYFPQAQTSYIDKEKPFDDPWPSCMTDASTPLAAYAEDFTTEWGKVPYFPPGPPHPLPQTPNFDFRDDTLWDEFLHRYYKPVADAGPDQYIVVPEGQLAWVTLSGCGSSDSDGSPTKYIWDLNVGANTDNGDWDKDKIDETDDDNDTEGHTVSVWLGCGKHIIKLTVWDDHQPAAPDTPEDYWNTTQVKHSNHWKTDQDSCIITVIYMKLHAEASLINPGNPVGTQWHELHPVYCRHYRLEEWEDTDKSGDLSPCDQIKLRNKDTGEEAEYHVDEVFTDIAVSPKKIPPTPTPRPPGGVRIPIDKLALLTPYISLGMAVFAFTLGAVYARKRWFRKAVIPS